jgi:hypothetical protein
MNAISGKNLSALKNAADYRLTDRFGPNALPHPRNRQPIPWPRLLWRISLILCVAIRFIFGCLTLR